MDRPVKPVHGISFQRGSLYFVLSKTLGIALLPINLLVELGILSLVLMLTRFAALGRKLAVTTLVLLVLAAFSPLGNLLLYPLGRASRRGTPRAGRPTASSCSAAPSTPTSRRRIARRSCGTRPIACSRRLISPSAIPRRASFSPGDREPDLDRGQGSRLFRAGAGEPRYPEERLILERDSRNTWENAIFTKQLVSPKPGERWLLVTSAFHMPRSMGIFRKAGFDVEAYPVDWRMGGRDDLFAFTRVGGEGLAKTDIAMREWIGLLAYRAMGRTSELLPGPATD